uniref:Uncharacterized protein n=1 Tax=Curvibacter symbiont subsp. Hydra magnipapillata TaxID=667019 RepID=C9YFN4_CURXX|nr:hypothetical protein Csp_B15840 [Curvibacter putative symbiont of Hydra magnipapillata]
MEYGLQSPDFKHNPIMKNRATPQVGLNTPKTLAYQAIGGHSSYAFLADSR